MAQLRATTGTGTRTARASPRARGRTSGTRARSWASATPPTASATNARTTPAGPQRAPRPNAPPDIRSLHVLTARRSRGRRRSRRDPVIRAWVAGAGRRRDGVVLKNAAYEIGAPHLWAHIQEGVLASTGALLDDPALPGGDRERRGRRPAGDRAGVRGAALQGVRRRLVHLLADRLHEATGDDRWSAAAADARAWFDGRNMANAPTYDPVRGRVADGIDEDRVSANSGAESNIRGPRPCSTARSRWRVRCPTRSAHDRRTHRGRPAHRIRGGDPVDHGVRLRIDRRAGAHPAVRSEGRRRRDELGRRAARRLERRALARRHPAPRGHHRHGRGVARHADRHRWC